MYGTRIKYGVIVVALPKREAQIFKFELGKYWEAWLGRLVGYWKEQSTPLAAGIPPYHIAALSGSDPNVAA